MKKKKAEAEEQQPVELTLKESVEHFRLLTKLSPVALCLNGQEGRIDFVNDRFTATFGYTLEDMPTVEAWFRLAYPDEVYRQAVWDSWREAVQKCRQSGKPFEPQEYWITCKDGTLCIAEVSASDIGANHLVVFNDVTARQRLEDDLKRAAKINRELLDNAPNPILATNLDSSIRYVNPAFEDLTGFVSEEVIGCKTPYPWWPSENIADLTESSREGQKKAINLKEFNYVKRNGERFWVASHIKKVTDGDIEFFLSNWSEITQQKMTEQALKESESRLRHAAEEWRTTFDSISDMVFIRNREGKIVRTNRAFAQAFKLNPKEMLGKTCCETMHGKCSPPQLCPCARVLETRKEAVVEYYEPALGLHVQESISPVLNDKKEPIGTVNVIRDVSQMKKMQDQLIMTDRLATIGELSAGIAHELNNPLTGVIGFSQLLLEGPVPPEMKEDLQIISNEAQRAAKIVKNLLTFARKREPAKLPFQLNDCICEVLDLRAYEQKNRNIVVTTHLDPGLPATLADYFQMQQVFINLIINAEYFMIEAHNGGTLAVTTERLGTALRASFADDGPGISPEDMKHLFRPFFTTKEVGKGTGLGLSICHGIVAQHGGEIYARSELGKGATFVVELPIKTVSS